MTSNLQEVWCCSNLLSGSVVLLEKFKNVSFPKKSCVSDKDCVP